MYVSPISSRFWVGRLTPAIRAMCRLALPLLVSGIGADDDRATVSLDHATAFAHRLDGRTDFHRYLTSPEIRAFRWLFEVGVGVRAKPDTAAAQACVPAPRPVIVANAFLQAVRPGAGGCAVRRA